jgi:hypothetical protein
MNFTKVVLVLLFSSFIIGCSHQQAVVNYNEKLATITEYEIKSGFIFFETIGYGCTFYNNYKVVKASNDLNQIEVIQLVSDNCQMTPRGISLTYSFKHLNLDLEKEVTVKNMPTITDFSKMVSK